MQALIVGLSTRLQDPVCPPEKLGIMAVQVTISLIFLEKRFMKRHGI
jgi:hypothetical protein